MPATSPRIYVTLPDEELADGIRRIGLGAGISASAVVGAILAQQRQALLSLADAMDKARAIQGPLSGALTAVLGRSEADLNAMAHEAMGALDELHLVLDQALEEAGVEAPPRRPQGERGGASAPSQQPVRKRAPPYINKGVRK